MSVSTVPVQTQASVGPIPGNAFLKDVDTLDNVLQGSTTKKLSAAELAALQNEQTYLQHAIREVQFEALAARRRAQYPGSGFIEWGKHTTGVTPINEGMDCVATRSNFFGIGRGAAENPLGISKTNHPIALVNGVVHHLHALANGSDSGKILMPPAPGTVAILTRYDLVILEVWHELVSDKDVFFPFGNVQFGASSFTPSGGTAIALKNDGTSGTGFTGYETYSLYGNWQASSALIGYCVAWSTLSAANKILLLRNPEHNLYLNNAGQLVQVRYRVRTVQAPGGAVWTNAIDTAVDLKYATGSIMASKGSAASIAADLVASTAEGVFYNYAVDLAALPATIGTWRMAAAGSYYGVKAYNGLCFATPIALVYRQRNTGIFHATHNPAGCAAKNAGQSDPTNPAECFSIPHDTAPGSIASAATAHPSGFYHDEINAVDFTGGVAGDLRNSALSMPDFERGVRKWALRYLTTADALRYYPWTTAHTPSTDYLAYIVGHNSSQTALHMALKRDGNDLTHQTTGGTTGNKIGLSLVRVSGKLKLQICTEATTDSDDGVIALNSATGKKQFDIGLFVGADR